MKTNVTEVILKSDDQQYQEWKKGDRGYIDGYVRGGNNTPLACVVIHERIVLVPLDCLMVNNYEKHRNAQFEKER